MALQQTENSNILMLSYMSYGLFIVNDTQKNERTSHANSKDFGSYNSFSNINDTVRGSK